MGKWIVMQQAVSAAATSMTTEAEVLVATPLPSLGMLEDAAAAATAANATHGGNGTIVQVWTTFILRSCTCVFRTAFF